MTEGLVSFVNVPNPYARSVIEYDIGFLLGPWKCNLTIAGASIYNGLFYAQLFPDINTRVLVAGGPEAAIVAMRGYTVVGCDPAANDFPQIQGDFPYPYTLLDMPVDLKYVSEIIDRSGGVPFNAVCSVLVIDHIRTKKGPSAVTEYLRACDSLLKPGGFSIHDYWGSNPDEMMQEVGNYRLVKSYGTYMRVYQKK